MDERKLEILVEVLVMLLCVSLAANIILFVRCTEYVGVIEGMYVAR